MLISEQQHRAYHYTLTDPHTRYYARRTIRCLTIYFGHAFKSHRHRPRNKSFLLNIIKAKKRKYIKDMHTYTPTAESKQHQNRATMSNELN